MSRREDLSYRFLEVDGSLENVGLRFGVSVQEMFALNSQKIGRYRRLGSVSEFVAAVKPRHRILLPYRGDLWDWRLYPRVEEKTLAELCEKYNALPERKRSPRLDPVALWRHVLNASFRDHNLERIGSLDAQRAIDANPSNVRIRENSVLLIPYHAPLPLSKVRGGPYPKQAGEDFVRSRVLGPPDWIYKLATLLVEIQDTASSLKNTNDACEDIALRWHKQCGVLSLMHRVLEVLHAGAQPGGPWRDAIKAYQKKLLALYGEMMGDQGATYANPAAMIDPDLDKRRKGLAERLRDLVRSKELGELVRRAATGADEIVDGTSLRNRIAYALHDAYSALARSHEARAAIDDIDHALSVLGAGVAAGTPPAEEKSALPILLSVVGAVPFAAGNLPGPASLSVACIDILAQVHLPKLTVDMSDVCKLKVYSAFAERIRKYLIRSGNLGTADETYLNIAIQSGDRKLIKDAARLFAGKVQSSIGWTSGLAAINVLSLLAAAYQLRDFRASVAPDKSQKEALAKIANLTGAGFGTVTSVLAWVKAFDPEAPLGVALGKVAACFGVIAGVATIFSGAMTYMDGWDRHKSEDIWAGGLQAAGGLLSVGGFLLSNPYLQIAGTLLLLAAVATGNWTAIKEWLDDVSTPGTKKVFLKLVDSVGSAGIFERAAKQKASLKTAYDALLEATKTDRLALGDPFDTAEVRSALKGLGFSDKTIEGMTFRPMNPRLHPWPSP